MWQGVRRKEYEFIELPVPVKEKEAERLFEALSAERTISADLGRIPPGDRQDFLREWRSGNKEASYEVLNRKSYTDNVSLSAKREESARAVGEVSSHGTEIKRQEPANAKQTSAGDSLGELELGLGDLELVSQPDIQSVPPLPGAKGSGAAKGS